jgi:SAM-dependent methyltransferase
VKSGQPSDRLRETYERRAELEYAEPAPPPDPRVDRKFERVWQLVSEHLPCDAFLDAGCGDGRHLAALARTGLRPSRVTGTDISARILETARAAAAPLEPELVQANLEALPLEDGAFDLVLCTQVIEHLLDPAAGVRELARVLVPGGVLVLTTDNRRALVSKTLNAPRATVVRLLRLHPRYKRVEFPHADFTRAEAVALVAGAGLTVAHAETFRFTIARPLGRPAVQRLLNRIEKSLPAHGVGDLVAVVARKPA